MKKVFASYFLQAARLFALLSVVLLFHLLAPRTSAYQPTPGTWTLVGLGSNNIRALAVDPNNPNVLYASTDVPQLLKSTDGGATWSQINNGLPTTYSIGTIAIDPSNSNIVYAGGGEASQTVTGLFKSTDGGMTWTFATIGINPVDFSGFPPAVVVDIAINPANPSILYAAIGVHCGEVYKSTDGAGTWTRLSSEGGLRSTKGPSKPIEQQCGVFCGRQSARHQEY